MVEERNENFPAKKSAGAVQSPSPPWYNWTIKEERMVTIQIDLNADIFPDELLFDGADATGLPDAVVDGVGPDKLTVLIACGPGGGNPVCNASFSDEAAARAWFAFVADDDSPGWFEENVVERV
jgi:hypothetical protein